MATEPRKRLADMNIAISGQPKLPRELTKMVEDTTRVEVLENHTIVNGHHLKAGTILELSASDIDTMRDHGLRLGPVVDDDRREIFDHTQDVEEVTEDKPLRLRGHDR